MPAVEGPPSLALKNLIWVAFGLPRSIDQATTVPARGAATGLCVVPTFTWKPVVRLTARQGLPGQLGTVSGLVVGGITPTSVSVACGARGQHEHEREAREDCRCGCTDHVVFQHDRREDVAVSSLFPRQFLRGGRDLRRISGRGNPRQPQRIARVAGDHVHVEVEDRLPRERAAGVDQVDPLGPQQLLRADAPGVARRAPPRADPRGRCSSRSGVCARGITST